MFCRYSTARVDLQSARSERPFRSGGFAIHTQRNNMITDPIKELFTSARNKK